MKMKMSEGKQGMLGQEHLQTVVCCRCMHHHHHHHHHEFLRFGNSNSIYGFL